MTKKENRIPFQIKLLPEHHKKLMIESEKLSLNMSAFVSLLIEKYEETSVKFHK